MADRYSPVTLHVGNEHKVRCASNRRYAVVQLVNNPKWTQGSGLPLFRAKVLFRSDSAHYIAERVRKLGGWNWVFSLKDGTKLWENASSEWPTIEQAIHNNEARRA